MSGLFLCQWLTLTQAWFYMAECMTGPGVNTPGMPTVCSTYFDWDHDGDVDLRDVSRFIAGEVQ